MLVRAPARPRSRKKARTQTYPGSVGWVTYENVAAMSPGSALVMDNFSPRRQGARIRGGSKKVATIGSDAVKSLFAYNSAAGNAFFAASETDIYEITAFNAAEAPTPDVSSQTSGAWIAQQIGTSGGEYLMCVNGADDAELFNGSSWQAVNSGSSPVSITGVATADLSYVWLYRQRVWFIEKDSLSAWCLPVTSVGGAAQELSLGDIVVKGGKLLFGATWSQDAGDGSDDRLVLVTDQGEAVIYQGSDPNDTTTPWNLVGRYDISPPLGPKAHMRAGGDLLIATTDGLIPLSQAVTLDKDALKLAAVSNDIKPDWLREVQSSNTAIKPWELIRFPREESIYVSLPHTGTRIFMANIHTGQWARYTGWNAQTLGLYENLAYFGDASGSVFRCESGGQDDGAAYVCKLLLAFDDLGEPGAHKQANLIRVKTRSFFEVPIKASVAAEYDTTFPAALSAFTGSAQTAALWGSGIWGTSLWGDGGDAGGSDKRTVTTRWRSVAGNGDALAPQIQATIGSAWRPDTELVDVALVYESGGVVV